MRVAVAVILVLLAGSFAGCFGNEAQGPVAGEAEAPWDGRLVAVDLSVDVNRFDADGKRLPPHYTLMVVPTPGAPLEMPRNCRVDVHPGADDVGCLVDTPRPWEREVWGSCFEPDGQDYIITWLLRIVWSSDAAPDGPSWEERITGWSAGAVGDDGSRQAAWNGTVADCPRADLPIHMRPPPKQLLSSWTWHGRNHTLMEGEGNGTTSFVLTLGNCMVVEVNGTIDRFGYRLRLVRGDDVVWTDHVEADPGRHEGLPYATNTIVYRPGVDVDYHIAFEHDTVPPPAPELAQTEVHVTVTAYIQCALPD